MRIAERRGWVLLRIRGDHYVYRHPEIPLNLSIPDKREVPEGTLRGNIRTMRLTVDEFLRALKQ